jgi:hypothetical protein
MPTFLKFCKHAEFIKKCRLIDLYSSACKMFNTAKKRDLQMTSMFPFELSQIVGEYLNWTKIEFAEILFQPVADEWLDLKLQYVIVYAQGNIYLCAHAVKGQEKCERTRTREIVANLNFLASIPANEAQTQSPLLTSLQDILLLKLKTFSAKTSIAVV